MRTDAKTKTFYLEKATPEEIARMDATFERVSPDVERWMHPGTQARRGENLRWDPVSRTLWLFRFNREQEEKLDAKYERVKGELRWKVEEDGYTLQRGRDYLAAKLSGSLDPTESVVLTRMASCLPCDALKKNESGSYCDSCGCGPKVPMILPDGSPASKILFRTLNCPKFQKGFSNA